MSKSDSTVKPQSGRLAPLGPPGSLADRPEVSSQSGLSVVSGEVPGNASAFSIDFTDGLPDPAPSPESPSLALPFA